MAVFRRFFEIVRYALVIPMLVFVVGTGTVYATTCDTGYSAESSNLETFIGTGTAVDHQYIDTSEVASSNPETYGLTQNGTFAVNYQNKGILYGSGVCSSQSGTGAYSNPDSDPIATTASEITAQSSISSTAGKYCWCHLDGFEPVNGTKDSINSYYVYYNWWTNTGTPYTETEFCEVGCATACSTTLAETYSNDLLVRSRILSSVSSPVDTCQLNSYECAAGTYLPSGATSCQPCLSGDYACGGGTYNYNANADQGITECQPCAGTNATCSVSVVNNVCTYTTSCSSGQIQNDGLYNAYCVESVTCSAGTYLPANSTTCTTCPADSFCGGGTYTFSLSEAHGATACSTLSNNTYPNSDAGASANTQCYRTCTTTDVEGSATVAGNKYYGGEDGCYATSCVSTGYTYDDTNTAVQMYPGSGYTSSGTRTSEYYGLSNWTISWSGVGTLSGTSKCTWSEGQMKTYCNCTPTQWVTSTRNGSISQSFTLRTWNSVDLASCNDSCPGLCRGGASTMFGSSGLTYTYNGTPGHCLLNNHECAVGTYLPAGSDTCAPCVSGNVCPGGAFNYNPNENQGMSSVIPSFTITTTAFAANTIFKFQLSAKGSFTVDWGDGNVETINRDNTTLTQYTHTYENAGPYDIEISGSASEYNPSTYSAVSTIRFGPSGTNTPQLIAGISGSLGGVFPTLNDGSSVASKQPEFIDTFSGCTNLTSLPSTLFDGVFGMGQYMFDRTFNGCTGLTSVPSGLFSGIFLPQGASNFGYYMFYSTFYGCTNLTTVPYNLFAGASGNVSAYAFYNTFYNDTKLNTFVLADGTTTVSYIPIEFFGTLLRGSATSPMTDIFYGNTKIAATCPSGMVQYITGFESYWNSRVSCTTGYPVALYQNNSSNDDTVVTNITVGNNVAMPSKDNNNTALAYPTRTGYTFTGYYDARTDGTKYYNADLTSAKKWESNNGGILYAQWTQCPACNTTNASCEFVAVENNVCTYSTVCDSGYGGIQNNGQYDASCSTSFACAAGTYRLAGTAECVECTAGSYCPGGTFDTSNEDQGIFACSSLSNGSYVYSAAGATASSRCYRLCTSSDSGGNIAHGIPYMYYGSSSCKLEKCKTGYIFQPAAKTSDIVGSSSSLGYVYYGKGSGGIYYSGESRTDGTEKRGAAYYGLSGTGWAVDFGEKGFVVGAATSQSTYSDTLSSSTSANVTGGFNCFCKLTKFVTPDGRATSQNTEYVNVGSGGTVAGCTFKCAQTISETVSKRTTLLSKSGTIPAFCEPEKYVCPAGKFLPADATACATCLANHYCVGGTFFHDEVKDQGIEACTACATTNASCTLSVVNNTCKYSTSCNTGYTNIQNNGAYNASCEPQYTVTYACGDGATGTAPNNGKTYNGATFTPSGQGGCLKTDRVFTGWLIDGTETVVNSAFTYDYTTDKTLTAQWAECPACATTNATCTYSSVVDNVCTYITVCESGYGGIQDNGRYNASCGSEYTVTYLCGDGATGTPPGADTAYADASFAPADSGTCAKTDKVFGGWLVSGTETVVRGAFTWNYNENKTFTAQWRDPGFTITTTEMTAGTVFKFQMSAAGTFTVDWGDGTVEPIDRTGNTTLEQYTHTYAGTGPYTITFGGSATGYNTGNTSPAIRFGTTGTNTPELVGGVSGSLGTVFPTLGSANGQQPRFNETFKNCVNITEIPSNLFDGVTGNTDGMFRSTFDRCYGITQIPGDLFDGVTGNAANMFRSTFYECKGLEDIPADLFSTVSGVANGMFMYTFNTTTGLSGKYIPATLFDGLNGATATDLFSSCFAKSNLLESCPTGTTDVTPSAYVSLWNNKVACSPNNYTCAAGTYLPANSTTCAACTAGNYCPGGEYTFSQTSASGLNACSELENGDYTNSVANATANTACYKACTTDDIANSTAVTGNNYYGAGTDTCEATACDNGYDVEHGACVLSSIECAEGTYLPAGETTCAACLTGNYACPGGTYTLGDEHDQGIYTMYTVTYNCGTGTGTAPESATAYSGQTFTPASTTNCSVANKIFAGWAVSDTNDVVDNAFTWNYESNKTLTAQYTDAKFTMTTMPFSSAPTYGFSISASGKFYVDWGDGTFDIIDRTNDTTNTAYSHTYTTAGAKTIKIGGLATGYNDNNVCVAAISLGSGALSTISGSLGAIFPTLNDGSNNLAYQPRFCSTFAGAANLTSVPSGLFSGVTGAATDMFNSTFVACHNLTTIPSGLFGNGLSGAANNMFYGTFRESGVTTVPSGLFSGISGAAAGMFNSTFMSCSSLAALPSGLFSGVSGAASGMFQTAFSGCTSLTTVPYNLFAGVSGAAPDTMFSSAFYNDTALDTFVLADGTSTVNYIPAQFFGSISSTGAAPNAMNDIFANNTAIADECPSGTTQNITGFEEKWNGRVSCRTTETYTITYMDGENEITGLTPTTYTENTATNLPTVATKAGYTFDGWYANSGLTGDAVTTIASNETGNKTYYAKFTACPVCAATNATCTFDGVVNNVCSYTTACETGYGNIQNEDEYNVSCAPQYTVTYNCGTGATGTPPNSVITYNGESFTPAVQGSCAKEGKDFAGWLISGTETTVKNDAFTWNYNENKTFTAQWVDAGFTVTTTSLAANAQFKFKMSAAGVFYVDWGDGTPIQIIDRTDNITAETYTHTYATAGSYNIKITGRATGYNASASVGVINFGKGLTPANVASVSGIMGSVFPTLESTSVTDADIYPRFFETFQECAALTTVSGNLFNGVTGATDSMFRSTFDKCTALTGIPSGLFSGVSGHAPNMFRSTFYNCGKLTTIPADLFSDVDDLDDSEFKYTFYGFGKDATDPLVPPYIPATLFRSVEGKAYKTDAMYQIFRNSALVTSCPEHTTQYTTGFETYWDSKKACIPDVVCEGATYASGGVCVDCPSGYTANTGSGKIAANQCQITCPAGKYLAEANDATCSDVGIGYYTTAPATVYYGETSERQQCGENRTTDTATSTSASACECMASAYDNNGICELCPFGYDDNNESGKTSISQCQIYCPGGQWTNSYTQLSYIEGDGANTFIDTGYVIKSKDLAITVVMSVPTSTSGTAGNFFGNHFSSGSGGFSASYKNGVFGLWSKAAGTKLSLPAMTFDSSKIYTMDYTVNTSNYQTIKANDGTNDYSNDRTASFTATDNTSTFKIFSNGASTVINDSVNLLDGDALFAGRIHSFRMTDNGNLVLDLVPARRNSDNAIGMYNRANGEFYTSVTSGSFTAGTDGSVFAGALCTNVGDGYYAGASYTNYGSLSTRTQCPNGAATNMENAQYKRQCVGQNTVTCAAGTYLPANANDMECETCLAGSFCGGGTFGYDASLAQGITACSTIENGAYPNSAAGASANTACYADCTTADVANATSASGEKYYNGANTCVPTDENSCDTGYHYVATSGNVLAHCEQDASVGIVCARGTYLPLGEDTCATCPQNSYCAGGTFDINDTMDQGIASCPSSLYSASGMWESAQCGHKLHIGDAFLYLRSVKKTIPSLNIDIDNDGTPDFFGNMAPGDWIMNSETSRKLKVLYNNEPYSVYDDTVAVDGAYEQQEPQEQSGQQEQQEQP